MTASDLQTEGSNGLETALEFIKLVLKLVYIVLRDSVLALLPKERKNLADEVVLITGGGHGMGRQVALNMSHLGAKVVLWDINEKGVRETAELITKKGGKAAWYVCDVTSESSVKTVAKKVEEEFGMVTILINNAGIMQNVPMMEMDSSRIKQTMEVNVLAHFWTIRAFLPSMEKNDRGHIVAMASAAGLVGHVNQIDYSASKYAVIGLMEAFSAELRLKKSNIKLTTVCPLTVSTGLNQYPITKASWLMPIVTTEDAANQIVDAIRREDFIITIPRSLYSFITFAKNFPRQVINEVIDFTDYCTKPNFDASSLPPLINEQYT